MISKIDQKNAEVAKEIYAVFQRSYAVEAQLLKALDFPPLRRTVTDFVQSNTEFYGFLNEEEIVAVIEIKREEQSMHIQSLVVDPKFFRQGIASKLLAFVFETFTVAEYTVETGANNLPAITLYKGFHFLEVTQWDTDHGVRKVKFERKVSAKHT